VPLGRLEPDQRHIDPNRNGSGTHPGPTAPRPAHSADGVHFPRPSDGKKMVSFDWTPIRYRNVISVLKNPFYAGVYAYGKSEKRRR